ncbi:Mediator of RNA polymerase ii transcription subunit, partial [Globisporangium splendens]
MAKEERAVGLHVLTAKKDAPPPKHMESHRGAAPAPCGARSNHGRRDRSRRVRDCCKCPAGALHWIPRAIHNRTQHASHIHNARSVLCIRRALLQADCARVHLLGLRIRVLDAVGVRTNSICSVVAGAKKHMTKHWIGKRMPKNTSMEDLKPEVVTLNAEIFHALYVSICMQHSTSKLTVAILMVFDILHASVPLHQVQSHVQATSRLWTQPPAVMPTSQWRRQQTTAPLRRVIGKWREQNGWQDLCLFINLFYFHVKVGRLEINDVISSRAFDMSQAQQDDAAATEGPEIVSEFPAPPAFFVLYRDGADQGPAPPEPMEPQYHMFGTPYSTQDAVPDLLPQEGRKLYLNAKNSAGANASSVKSDGAAAEDADGAAAADEGAEKSKTEVKHEDNDRIDYKAEMKKCEQLFLNMHNLINTFRPHQARETVIEMLKAQIKERREAIQDIRKTIDDSRKAVEQTHAELHDASDDASRADAVDVKMENVDGQDDDKAHNKALENGLMSPTGGHLELHSARAQETRQMQEEFFSALDAALES